ncbi:hypothetical protein HYU18_01820 [Candidatus Woesearchaeota archaeon]|nr:hypothetical protein [Candidatus Woesearchaeota archaeon]
MAHTCSACGKAFDAGEALEQHRQSKHVQHPAAAIKAKRKVSKKIIVAAVVLLLVAGAYFAFAGKGDGAEKPVIGGDSGGFDEKAFAAKIPKGAIHWHPHVTILIKGKPVTIPANLGLEGSVHKPVHTHDTDNILHWEVQFPTVDNMQLGYFFEKVWKKKFNSECILDSCSGPDGAVKMSINGVESTEFEHYMPKDGDEIKIVFE